MRRDEQKKADDQGKEVLKGTRWLLLKKPRNLDDERNESERLREALEVNQSLATAYPEFNTVIFTFLLIK
ncbi:MAG: transposase [Magnetococcales bacterium]|nr:transposase [Magnetococcales bacterium]